MRQLRLNDNAGVQLTLAAHLALLFLMAALHLHWRDVGPYRQSLFGYIQSIYGGVFIAQVALIACWAAFSRSHLSLRVGSVLLLVPLLAAVQSQVFVQSWQCGWWRGDPQDMLMRYTIWAEELGFFACLVASFGILPRCLGWRLELSESEGSQQVEPYQFRLLDIFYWMVLLGLTLAAAKWLEEHGWTWGRAQLVAGWILTDSFTPQLEFTVLAVLLAAFVFSPRWFKWSLPLAIFAPLVLSLVDTLWFEPWMLDDVNKSYPRDYYALTYFAFSLTFGGTLLVIRDRGFLLTWRKRWSAPPVTGSP